MSYTRMTIYSFSCDNPGGCKSIYGDGEEVLPSEGPGLRAAEKELRHSGWTVRDGRHYCPDHKPAAGQGGAS